MRRMALTAFSWKVHPPLSTRRAIGRGRGGDVRARGAPVPLPAAAAALTAHGIDKKTYENKLVFLMGIEKARFRNPVIPDCTLELNIEATRSHGKVWKYKGEAFVEGKRMADAQWSATIVDRK